MGREIFEKEEDNEIEIPKEKRKLSTVSYDYSVEFIVSLMSSDNPKIILEVPFQRKFIWKNDRASQLIESIIMNVPIPPLYFAEEEDGKWLIVDGLQRLNSIKSFFDNEFNLRKLEIIKELEGIKFKDLPPKSKSLLKDGLLRVNVIKKDSHPDIKYDIFMRLNKGAVILNTQELRNCLYRGHLNDMAKDIVKQPLICKLLNLKAPHNRFLDVEFILRYLAFSESLENDNEGYYIKNYKGSLKSFLNDFMESKKDITEQELENYKEKILSTFDKVLAVFGEDRSLRNPESKSAQINKAFADCVLLSFEKYDKNLLQDHRSELVNLYDEFFKDEKFLPLISKRTSDSEVIKRRLNLWFKGIEDVIES